MAGVFEQDVDLVRPAMMLSTTSGLWQGVYRMDVIEESLKLHRQAWSDSSKFDDYLEQAVKLLRPAYQAKETDLLLLNNYAAVLLDRNQNAAALNLLKRFSPDFSEYCQNYAIAIAKSSYDITLIRKWNRAASTYPNRKHAIVAFMDWQAL